MMNSELGEGTEENDVEASTATGSEDNSSQKRRKVIPLPPPGKGILISPGFRYFYFQIISRRYFLFNKSFHCIFANFYREKTGEGSTLPPPKEVKFADGVKPGDGTSPSAGEEIQSPPPSEKVQKKKTVKKKRQKKKIKV